MTPVPKTLLFHGKSAKDVPMCARVCHRFFKPLLTVIRYSGSPFELVFYIGDGGPESGWWPFGTASHFNDLIDNSAGCKVACS